jgi:hypothetical protein
MHSHADIESNILILVMSSPRIKTKIVCSNDPQLYKKEGEIRQPKLQIVLLLENYGELDKGNLLSTNQVWRQ